MFRGRTVLLILNQRGIAEGVGSSGGSSLPGACAHCLLVENGGGRTYFAKTRVG